MQEQIISRRVNIPRRMADQCQGSFPRQKSADRLIIPEALLPQLIEAEGKAQQDNGY